MHSAFGLWRRTGAERAWKEAREVAPQLTQLVMRRGG